jgi:hypothetical protein
VGGAICSRLLKGKESDTSSHRTGERPPKYNRADFSHFQETRRGDHYCKKVDLDTWLWHVGTIHVYFVEAVRPKD